MWTIYKILRSHKANNYRFRFIRCRNKLLFQIPVDQKPLRIQLHPILIQIQAAVIPSRPTLPQHNQLIRVRRPVAHGRRARLRLNRLAATILLKHPNNNDSEFQVAELQPMDRDLNMDKMEKQPNVGHDKHNLAQDNHDPGLHLRVLPQHQPLCV